MPIVCVIIVCLTALFIFGSAAQKSTVYAVIKWGFLGLLGLFGLLCLHMGAYNSTGVLVTWIALGTPGWFIAKAWLDRH